MVIVVMGVTGCGKSTIGKLLAEKIGLPFYDADDFHPETNVAKMKSGVPLDDTDRQPWLERISAQLSKAEASGGCVLACSALKEVYRKQLQQGVKDAITWIHLSGSPEVILERMNSRTDHFMPSKLLHSQFEILEIPEDAHHVSILLHPEMIVAQIIQKIL